MEKVAIAESSSILAPISGGQSHPPQRSISSVLAVPASSRPMSLAMPGDISRQNSRQPPFHALTTHDAPAAWEMERPIYQFSDPLSG